MSLVATDIGFFPSLPLVTNTGASPSIFTFDASADLLALVCQVPKTGTISKVHYRILTNGGTCTATHRIELRTVDVTTGLPNAAGTLYGSSSTVSVGLVLGVGYTANTNVTAAVNATAATAGDLVAVVFDFSAYTTGSFTMLEALGRMIYGNNNRLSSFPYVVRNTTGSAAKATDFPNAFIFEYSDGTYLSPVIGGAWVGTGASYTFSSSAAIRRVGNKFTPRTKRRAIGINWNGDMDGGVIARIRSTADDSVLAESTTPDSDVRGTNTQNGYTFLFDAGATLTMNAGTAYRVLVEGGNTTSSNIIGLATAPAAAALGAMPGGQNCFLCTHDGTSYDDTVTTSRAEITVITDQEDDGTGGGGGLLRANMSGGVL